MDCGQIGWIIIGTIFFAWFFGKIDDRTGLFSKISKYPSGKKGEEE